MIKICTKNPLEKDIFEVFCIHRTGKIVRDYLQSVDICNSVYHVTRTA